MLTGLQLLPELRAENRHTKRRVVKLKVKYTNGELIIIGEPYVDVLVKTMKYTQQVKVVGNLRKQILLKKSIFKYPIGCTPPITMRNNSISVLTEKKKVHSIGMELKNTVNICIKRVGH